MVTVFANTGKVSSYEFLDFDTLRTQGGGSDGGDEADEHKAGDGDREGNGGHHGECACARTHAAVNVQRILGNHTGAGRDGSEAERRKRRLSKVQERVRPFGVSAVVPQVQRDRRRRRRCPLASRSSDGPALGRVDDNLGCVGCGFPVLAVDALELFRDF